MPTLQHDIGEQNRVGPGFIAVPILFDLVYQTAADQMFDRIFDTAALYIQIYLGDSDPVEPGRNMNCSHSFH
jgi:hypothetical protein